MSDQLALDLEAGRAARDAALEAVADPPWRAFAERALRRVARRQQFVTSDDVWVELDRMGIPRPLEGRAIGSVMMAAVRSKLLEPTGFVRGTDPKHHADIQRLYLSLWWLEGHEP